MSAAPTFCGECGCQTGGGTFCYKHAPYTVRPLKNGSFVVDRNGQRTVTFYEPPSPAGEGAQETPKVVGVGPQGEGMGLQGALVSLPTPASLPPERAALVERLEKQIADEESSGEDACANLDLLRAAAAALRGETD